MCSHVHASPHKTRTQTWHISRWQFLCQSGKSHFPGICLFFQNISWLLFLADKNPFATTPMSHLSLKLRCQLSFGPVCGAEVSPCRGCAGPLGRSTISALFKSLFVPEEGQSLALQCIHSPGLTCEHRGPLPRTSCHSLRLARGSLNLGLKIGLEPRCL